MKKIVLHRYDLKLLLDCIELTLDYYRYNAFVRRFKNTDLIETENRIRYLRDVISSNFEEAKRVDSAFVFDIDKKNAIDNVEYAVDRYEN